MSYDNEDLKPSSIAGVNAVAGEKSKDPTMHRNTQQQGNIFGAAARKPVQQLNDYTLWYNQVAANEDNYKPEPTFMERLFGYEEPHNTAA